MKKISVPVILFSIIISAAFCKKAATAAVNNAKPVVSLKTELINTMPFTFRFTAIASDADNDPLEYHWDFGDGTKKTGNATETFSYPENKEYTVKLTVSDKNTSPVDASIVVDTKIITVRCDPEKSYQTIEGFGGFGAQDVYWSNGPFTSAEFINSLVNDLGVTIIRDELPTSFEINNDNNDPFVTDLAKFNLDIKISGHHEPLKARLQYWRDLKAAGVKTFIASVWSPPPWMKYNNQLGNGTDNQNSAPPYNSSPTLTTNQLKTDLYEEFAEMCVAYIKVIKRETGIDLYALSIQNEPRFSQFYQSCVYNGVALRDLLKVVGKRFKDEGLTTKLFLPEDIGWLQGIEGFVKPVLDDPSTRQYADIIAVHGYDLDGIAASSPNAQTWQTMYAWGASYGKPLWMTETSGFANTYQGAMSLAKAIFTAVKFGNISAWTFWTLSTGKLDEYSLMSSTGEKSKRYYTSKNFYKFIRPGSVRIEADCDEAAKVFPLAFKNAMASSNTLILINDNKETAKAVQITWPGSANGYNMYVTSAGENCKDYGMRNPSDIILLPPYSVTTLYSKK